MRKTDPVQLAFGPFAQSLARQTFSGSNPRSKRPAGSERKITAADVQRSRTNAEHCRHLLATLDLLATQQRQRGVSLAELYAAFERHHGIGDAAPPTEEARPTTELEEFESIDTFTPKEAVDAPASENTALRRSA
ncbi:MAG: hypothetical protein HOW73_41305 [Polyangiaceae bacterium]|nr:hypothetical protein [Polyangiaceae bacterium]